MTRALLCFLVAVAYLQPLECSFGESIDKIRALHPLFKPLQRIGSITSFKNLLNPYYTSPASEKTSSADSKPSHAYYSSASSGSTNKYSGWPITPVKFNHPIQSPVDLITSKAVTMDLPVLDIIEPDMEGMNATIYNSGHTVYIYVDKTAEDRPYLSGGPLKKKFIFEQMHFHWGSEDIWGSEHFVDGESYAVEIHGVHYNSEYETFEEAATKPDGLAVLTIFAEADNTDNPLLEPLYNLLPEVEEARSSVTLDCNKALQWPSSALSTNTEYYTYPGSLTTKPYTENVAFILLPKPIKLSFTQLSKFRELHSEDDDHPRITDNKRQLQPLHNRPIVRSTKLQ